MTDIQIPFGYGTTYKPLSEVKTWLLVHHHPEYVRRLVAWLASKNGEIGVGGGWRLTQPLKPGVAPEGKSFHQDQQYNDGFVGACAVDLVANDGVDDNFNHDSVRWSMVLPQGTPEATKWGLHCNVDGEPWHMQPIEIDGWSSWVNAGRPAPRAGYKLPGPVIPTVPPVLRLGSTGESVRLLQVALRVGADGQFGPITDAALRAFQHNAGITVDGVYGSQSFRALTAYYSSLAAV
jgi:hypothetical protein